MKKVLFLVAVLVACAFIPVTMAETAQETDGAEIDVWYYYHGTAPTGEDGIFKLVRMDKIETTWPNCKFTLSDIPDRPEYENFTFSHWAVWVETNAGHYLLGKYSDEEIRDQTIVFTPEKPNEVPLLFWINAEYSYDRPESESGSGTRSISPFIIMIILSIGFLCLGLVLSREY